MTTRNAEVALADSDRRFFGHPLGLANLSGIELWERFSFYGMQGLLAYYIYYAVGDGGLGYSQEIAASIVGAYGGLVYASAILGGWVSDRLLGAERTLFGAAVMIMLGHLSLALVPGAIGLGIGLVLVGVGAGTLKATTSTVVGDMYRRTDDRRDAAFSIYYMAVNIGGLTGPLLTGVLWDNFGFHWGFGAAAAGMAIGLIQYVAMRGATLKGVGAVVPDPLPRPQRVRYLGIGAVVAVLVVAAIATGLVPLESLADIVTAIAVVGAIALFALLITSAKTEPVERSRVVSFIPMFVASVAFWALFQQQFTVIAIYSDQRLDRNLGGWEMPASWVQSINPLFIIIFAAVFATLWVKLGNRQPSSPMKFALANQARPGGVQDADGRAVLPQRLDRKRVVRRARGVLRPDGRRRRAQLLPRAGRRLDRPGRDHGRVVAVDQEEHDGRALTPPPDTTR
jgi:POT family proton-dependent oligopeptide transporter